MTTNAKLDRGAFARAMGLRAAPCNGRRDCPCANCEALREHSPEVPPKAPGHTRVEYAPEPDRSPYPVPSHAAHVWIANGALHLGLPPAGPGSRGTTVSIPLERCGIVHAEGGMAPRADQLGWQALLTTLQARTHQGRPHTAGTPGAPVQYDLDKVLKSMGRTSVPRAAGRGKIELTDEDLGL